MTAFLPELHGGRREGGMPDHDQRRSLSYGRAYHLKGGSYAEQRRGGIALLMMIMPSVSITFSNYFSGILFTLLRQVTFAEKAEAKLETEGEVAALGVDVDHLAGVVFIIVHAFAAAGDTVFQLDIRGDHCVVCVLSVGGNRIVWPVSSTERVFYRRFFHTPCNTGTETWLIFSTQFRTREAKLDKKAPAGDLTTAGGASIII